MIPLRQAPPKFAQRYDAVMRGDEKLDTIPKLKDFWLFAIAQGWPHPEMREYIQELMVRAADKYYAPDFQLRIKGALWTAYFELNNQAIYKNPDTVEITEAERTIYDNAWRFLQHTIEDVRSSDAKSS